MGAFNIVRTRARCASCGRDSDQEIQFKYGDTWQHEYRLGDELKWEGNDRGIRDAKRVWIEGIGECPLCRAFPEFHVVLVDNRLDSVLPQKEGMPALGEKGYLIVEE